MTPQRPSGGSGPTHGGPPGRDSLPGHLPGHLPGLLPGLIAGAGALLFDFDGPVTPFFQHYRTAPIAQDIKDLLLERGVPLSPDVRASADSHGLLHLLRSDVFTAAKPGPEDQKTLELAEGIVTSHEYRAARDAVPGEHIEALVTALARLGKRLVIVSNNAEGPVRAYLERAGLETEFEAVFGRDPHELRHMKPHPHGVEAALRHLGLTAADCLLVGDQLTDLQAARAVGAPFLGHARNDAAARTMWREGAVWAGTSLLPLQQATEGLLNPN
ncbi:HAD family hydrolase [Streptomyces sp. G5(2025)]|uniref:HAD family hydrolase n=1 Tax=Streptomyces sp. G5(2025) TaxID=3406628 RepID=UPI003C136C82